MSLPTSKAIAVLLIAMLLGAVPAMAQTCASLSAQLEDVRSYFRDADKVAADPAAAKEAVKSLRAGLTTAATAAFDCRCPTVYTQLLDAASFARQAEDAATAKDFNSAYNRTVLSYNTAIDMLNHCPR